MNVTRRFTGSLAALLLALSAGGIWWVTVPAPSDPVELTSILRFDKEDLVEIRVVRADARIHFEREGERWVAPGVPWKPSASMVRRIAHQLHDLTARASVVADSDDAALYGLGPEAIRVELGFVDGSSSLLAVGDPNPTSVSWYVRELPGGPVHVVKKAAVDYFAMDLEAFREDRFATFDAPNCTAIDVDIEGRRLSFARSGTQEWVMTHPHAWSANRDQVRRILGAIASARALDFVADQPPDLSVWGLEEGADRVALTLDGGESIHLRIGDSIPGSDPAQRYVWREQDDAVYAVRASITDPLNAELPLFRNPRVVGGQEWELEGVMVHHDGQRIEMRRSADAWRWESGGEIPGATPARVASAAADLRAIEFHDGLQVGIAMDEPWAEVEVLFETGRTARITLGAAVDEGRLARVDGGPVVYTVSSDLPDRIEDLTREHRRWVDREAERR